MMPNRFLLRCVAVLSAVSLSDAAVPYHLSMSGMTSTDDYISVFEGVAFGYDVAYGYMQDLEEGRLPKFPCFEDGTLWESYVVNVNIETGLPFYVHQTAPTAEDALEPVEEMLGEWSADVFWGQFEGAKFDPDMTRYSWFRAMDRKFRVVGDGRWCRGGESVPVPTSLEKFGGGKDTAVKINATDLDGIYASLAIRFNYFDMDRDIGHANYSDPSDVRTKCFRVQFSSTQSSIQENCNSPDNGADTKAEALANAGISPTSVQSPTASGTTITASSASTSSTPEEDRGINKAYVSAGVGAAFGLFFILFVLFQYLGYRRKRLAAANRQQGEQGGIPLSRLPEAEPEPAPVYQPRAAEDEGRAAPEANGPSGMANTASGAAVNGSQPPPPNYEPPPRYEDINDGAPRRV
ncbi:hypothetical protein B0T11DRAFT_329281 [Plectosphaerella cucumerina]|uniref:Uncharacterized protein n=1 Tax=Plectosphaerella cucumerina TaxID=40658 RepID=A0A8K0TMV9_9PEZI|nr:hypothetical protein B0T11DRAFT_329281 [Plectosphaerella cucumerina]